MKRRILIPLLLLVLAAIILALNAPTRLEGEFILTEAGEPYLLCKSGWETDAFLLVNDSEDPSLLACLHSGDYVCASVSHLESTAESQTAYITNVRKIP